jgi:hypothetical protein
MANPVLDFCNRQDAPPRVETGKRRDSTLTREVPMKIVDVRERAKDLGLSQISRLKKGALIRTIQLAEGNFDCFGSPGRYDCLQFNCCWREDCLTSNPG